MSNALLTNKPKPTSVPKESGRKKSTAQQLSDVESLVLSFQEKFWETLSARALSGPADTPDSASSRIDTPHGVERLVDGTLEMAQLVLDYVSVPPQAEDKDLSPANLFEAAYSTIVHSVPPARRQQLLRSMLEGLEGVARAELQSEPAQTRRQSEDLPVSTAHFMAGLESQEREQRARDADDGLLVPGAQLASRLQMTPQGLHHALKAKRIFTMPGPSGELLYPAFFADQKQDRKTLEKVSKMLGDLPGAAKWDFFMSPRMSLGKRTPLEALAKGKLEAVMAAAQAFVEE